MKQNETISIDALIAWAAEQDVPLGKNPRRTLTYLATQEIIPKSVRGKDCKGEYEARTVKSRLLFYRDRRRSGWKTSEIRRALDRMVEQPADSRPPQRYPVKDALEGIPPGDAFRLVFEEFTEDNPESAREIVRFFDEQGLRTGTHIGSAFRQLIGVDRRLSRLTHQASLPFWFGQTLTLSDQMEN